MRECESEHLWVFVCVYLCVEINLKLNIFKISLCQICNISNKTPTDESTYHTKLKKKTVEYEVENDNSYSCNS